MPTSPLDAYFPLLIQTVFGFILACGLVGASYVLGKKLKNPVKDTPYECGMSPTGSARERFSVKFYLVAMLFILFDIEAVFLYPWVVVYRELKWIAFAEMFIFVALILCGFFYIMRKGVLDWSRYTPIRR
jgi:NADH-quinone oxidoreductase subunit A